jgi:hypothetical protein
MNAEQEKVLEAAVEVVFRRIYYRSGPGGTPAPSMEEMIMRVRKGGLRYLELLDGMKRCVDRDLETLRKTGLFGASTTQRSGWVTEGVRG